MTVKRVSAASTPSSAMPLCCWARAARRRSFASSQRVDSGMPRRSHSTRRAGRIPTKYIKRQALGPIPPISSQTPEARKLPIPAPDLQQPAALAAGVVGPQFGDERRSGHPFRADADADQKAQYRERLPIPGNGAQSGSQGISEDRQHHRPLAADVIGDDAADDAARCPAEDGGGQDDAGIARQGASCTVSSS